MVCQKFLEIIRRMLVTLIHREYLIRLLRRNEASFDSETSSCYSLAGLVYVPFCSGSILLPPESEKLMPVVLLRNAQEVANWDLRSRLDFW